MLPVLILGGIYGILGPLKFTVTEAAAVAVVYALVVDWYFIGTFHPARCASKSGVMMGSLFLIIVLAIAFNKFLAEQYIPQNAHGFKHTSTQVAVSHLGQHLPVGSWLCDGHHLGNFDCGTLTGADALSYGIHPLHFGYVHRELGWLPNTATGINLLSSTVLNDL